MFAGDAQLRLYVPKTTRTRLIREYHEITIAGNSGWQKVYHAMSQWYYWDDMKGDINTFVRACPQCQLYEPTPQPSTEIIPSPVLSRPFAEISLDWVSGLHRTPRMCDSVLNIIDGFSNGLSAYPV
jgi:hypothetical protein